ncbi:MAG TPA: dihydrolipoamide acetyltransferase family protein [Panacibacter sp.]|nr:dihydrolipoamide acetyltransferase family protein [Panacibacter sp.]
MAQVEMKMPKMGESVAEATIIRWLKNEGDRIEADESVLEIATDKVDSEVPSTTAGTLAKRLFNEGDVVQVGSVIAIINTGGSDAPTASPSTSLSTPAPAPAASVNAAPAPVVAVPVAAAPVNTSGAGRFYSPLVRTIAQQENISQSELDAIPGTGAEGRVTKKDVMLYLERRASGNVATPVATAAATPAPVAPSAPAAAPAPSPAVSVSGDSEIIEMDRMRKLIAKHMVDSKHTSPHVTSFVEADVTNMVLWREKVKKEFEKRENTKITFTPLFIDCLTRVIKRFPMVNSSLDGDKIILKKDINIGMATALPSGNLIVPVIRNADYLNLVGLSKQVNTLADNARNNKLKPDDTAGGTFTLTNVGTFGSLMGTPIINQPQVAILAVGAIKKRPVVIETEQGDTIGIRHMMYLSLSYDHRIVDGSLGASFLTAVAKEFEAWDRDRSW